jgi:hypothetical protein
MVDEIPKDIESLFKKSNLPVFRIDCSYIKSQNKFVPNDNLDELDPMDRKTAKNVQFIIQESPSRMAKCRICGVPIGKGEFRLGFPIRVKDKQKKRNLSSFSASFYLFSAFCYEMLFTCFQLQINIK